MRSAPPVHLRPEKATVAAAATAATLTRRGFIGAAAALAISGCAGPSLAADPLPSWNDGDNKRALLQFSDDVSRDGGPSFVPAAERIAVFDNDGTLWAEQPLYFQFLFMLDQVKTAAPRHPEWRDDPVFRALAANDRSALARLGERDVLGFLGKATAGMSADEYDRAIRTWLATARHPRFHRPYTELVYQPQLELLALLRRRGFKTFIVSGGNVEFMRPWSERAYGIPPEQVVGSQTAMRFSVDGDVPVLTREAAIDFVDDGPGKPVGIWRHIGRQPILAFGNSDGDLQMLQYTKAGPGPRMALLLHHDDADREFAYDRQSSVGKLDKAWDAALVQHWNVVSMRRDWNRIFPVPG